LANAGMHLCVFTYMARTDGPPDLSRVSGPVAFTGIKVLPHRGRSLGLPNALLELVLSEYVLLLHLFLTDRRIEGK
jgi:hypothetical protein